MLDIAKAKSMIYPPNTVKVHGKRLYSPLGVRKAKKEGAKPYVIGICGGPSSGKSSVAKFIKNSLPQACILNLIHFYKPIRGNLRRRSRANSIIEEQDKTEDEQK